MEKTHFLVIVISLVLSALVGQMAYAKKMYRWIDDKGNVFFSDQVPPDQIRHKREALSESVRVMEVVEAAKSKEQIELEKRLQKLRREQQKLIEKQRTHDRVLLSTFRNLEDMEMALKGKLQALDAQRKVAEGNRTRLEKQLRRQLHKAAQFERENRVVPEKLTKALQDTRQQLADVKLEINRHLAKRKQVEDEFKMDIARFKYLTQAKTADLSKLINQIAERQSAKELGLFICENKGECDKAWRVARLFVKTHSTTSLDIDTDRLVMSATPRNDLDLSLSVSKLKLDQQREQIFLDIRCKKSVIGMELCISPKIKQLRHEFNEYIEQRLPKSPVLE
jgi:hypothetical protein